MDQVDIYAQLRTRLIGELHVGGLSAGDRLPSIREVSRETGVDHRAVARAYQRLADEGLVAIQGRSGVVVAARRGAGGLLEETTRWLAEFAVEGWLRRRSLEDAADLTARAFAPGVRCVFVESTLDHEVAVCEELRSMFGLDVTVVRVGPGSPMTGADRRRVAAACEDCGFLVTTAFHAPDVEAVASRAGAAVIVVSVNALLREQIARMLQRRNVRVVMADPLYADRARQYMRGFTEGEHYHLVMAGSEEAKAALAYPMSSIFTRAAVQAMGLEEYPLFPGGMPFLSQQTAREVSGMVVQCNLGREPAVRISR